MKEKWRICKEDDRYAVSNMGRVASLYPTRKLIRGAMHQSGEYRVTIGRKSDVIQYLKISEMVLRNFKGDAPSDDYIPRHINGDKLDDRAENLEWKFRRKSCKNEIAGKKKRRDEIVRWLEEEIEREGRMERY